MHQYLFHKREDILVYEVTKEVTKMQFKIEKNELTRTDTDIIVAGNYFSTEANFELTGRWQENDDVQAYFKRGDLMLVSKLIGSKTFIPSDMLASEGFFEMSIVAQCDDGGILKSTVVRIAVSPSHNPDYPTMVIFRETKGEQGEKGEQGLKGDKGDRGLKGDKGDVGVRGTSAYEQAVKGGYTKNEQTFNTMLNATGTYGIKTIEPDKIYNMGEQCIYAGGVFTACSNGAKKSHLDSECYTAWWSTVRAQKPVNIYISPTGSNINGNGTMENPFSSMYYAAKLIPRDRSGQVTNIYLMPGYYSEILSINDLTDKSAKICIQGYTKDANDVQIYVFGMRNCTQVEIKNVTFKGGIGYPALRIDSSVGVTISNCNFGCEERYEDGIVVRNCREIKLSEKSYFYNLKCLGNIYKTWDMTLENVNAEKCGSGFYISNSVLSKGAGYSEDKLGTCNPKIQLVSGGAIW